MQTRHYTIRTTPEGTLVVEGLPPDIKTEVVVLFDEPQELRKEIHEISALFADHPFRRMSKAEILAALAQTRAEVAEEHYAHLP